MNDQGGYRAARAAKNVNRLFRMKHWKALESTLTFYQINIVVYPHSAGRSVFDKVLKCLKQCFVMCASKSLKLMVP